MASSSGNTARTLEQVKMGLCMLKGASYFTEDEWAKLDLLINKSYVWTTGPTTASIMHLDLQELINFDEDDNIDDTVHKNGIVSLDTIKEETKVIETGIESPSSSEQEDVPGFEGETPNGTSVEGSSDDEPISKPSEFPETIEPSVVVENPHRDAVRKPAEGGLAYYSKEQLEELKAFNNSMERFDENGVKRKPGRYNVLEDRDQGKHNQFPVPESLPSPTFTERNTGVQSWADEVAEAPEIIAPAPQKTVVTKSSPPVAVLAKTFKQIHGKAPGGINDVIQPNNPNFRPIVSRSVSRASNKTIKSIARTNSGLGLKHKTLNVAPGTVLKAQNSQPSNNVKITVRAGDKIRILKHASGQTHYAENITLSKESRRIVKGQISEDIFRLPSGMKIEQVMVGKQPEPVVQESRGHGRVHSSTSVTDNGLDAFENNNAAEWDDVPVRSRTAAPRNAAPTPAPVVKKPVGGLGSSRFALLDNCENDSSADEQEPISMTADQISQLVDEKFAQLVGSRATSAGIPTGPSKTSYGSSSMIRSKLEHTQSKKFVPKTHTCWFWAQTASGGDGCRFREEECANLHSHVPGRTGEDKFWLHNGKPTWSSLADHRPGGTVYEREKAEAAQWDAANQIGVNTVGGLNGSGKDWVGGVVGEPKSKFTCWYWAQGGVGCTYTSEACRYTHEPTPFGVAARPMGWKDRNFGKTDGQWRTAPGDWLKPEGVEGSSRGGWSGETSGGGVGGHEDEDEDGELVLERVGAGDDDDSWGKDVGWGDDSNKYKPPHIKAMEQQASNDAW